MAGAVTSRDELNGAGKIWGMVAEGVLGAIFCAVALTVVSSKLYRAYAQRVIWKRDYLIPEWGRYVSVVTEPGEFWWGVGFHVAWTALLIGYVAWRVWKHDRAYRLRQQGDAP